MCTRQVTKSRTSIVPRPFPLPVFDHLQEYGGEVFKDWKWEWAGMRLVWNYVTGKLIFCDYGMLILSFVHGTCPTPLGIKHYVVNSSP